MSVCLDIYLNNKWMDVKRNCYTSSLCFIVNDRILLSSHGGCSSLNLSDYNQLLSSRGTLACHVHQPLGPTACSSVPLLPSEAKVKALLSSLLYPSNY